MKRRDFCFVLLLLAACAVVMVWADEREIESGTAAREQAISTGNAGEAGVITVTKRHIYEGNLILVNRTYPVHKQGIKTDLVLMKNHAESDEKYQLKTDDIVISQDVAVQLTRMLEAANEDGVRGFIVNSGYRSTKVQKQQLYQEMGASYALPAGYSEHNVGLSLDIGSVLAPMHQAPEGEWLSEHAWRYGFVLRYPQDKIEITGIEYEPWHFRYIGLPHSAIMAEMNWAHEEYIEDLMVNKKRSYALDGIEYEISYYPVSNPIKIPIPQDRPYELSGNNVDGVIVTIPL